MEFLKFIEYIKFMESMEFIAFMKFFGARDEGRDNLSTHHIPQTTHHPT
jgi:hypothetical protein